MRVKAVIAYDGSSFEGFQRQKRTKNTITTAIEEALNSLGVTSKITGSGRTDAKVHATGQVIHFDLPLFWENQSLLKLQTHLNKKLAKIEFKSIEKSSLDFHARFSAKRRRYRYIFKLKKPNLFERDYISFLEIKDLEKFKKALNFFQGTHDFGMLSKKSETKSTIRKIFKTVLRRKKDYYFVYIEGDGFLRAQIRAMIGLAVEFANSKITEEEFLLQLQNKKRVTTSLVEPNGLYLAKVFYQE